ncbi:MAG TPA: hypothetical protein VH165_33175 [Kofleriaceae bacterium]|nr:hypothetical protein [Kofleriaceae bacterium]
MQWMKFYYANPTPDRLVDEVCALDAAGTLDPPARRVVIATFLGRVFAANEDRITGWLDTLSERLVSEGARNTLQVAAYFSNTPAAFVWLVHSSGGDPAKMQPSPDLLAGAITEPVMIDSLWAYYFATGDARAVRRVVSVFEHLPDTGAAARLAAATAAMAAAAPGDPEPLQPTQDDRLRAQRDQLYQAAAWSLATLMKEHPPLLQLCEWMLNGPDLTPDERLSLGLVLERAAPEVWSVEIHPGEDRARIHKRTGGPGAGEVVVGAAGGGAAGGGAAGGGTDPS